MTPADPREQRAPAALTSPVNRRRHVLPPGVRRLLRWLRALVLVLSLLMMFPIVDAIFAWRGQQQYEEMLLEHWASGCTENQPCRFTAVPESVCRAMTGSVPLPITAWLASRRWRGQFAVDGGQCGDPQSVVVFVGPENIDTGESDWLPRYE